VRAIGHDALQEGQLSPAAPGLQAKLLFDLLP
jgi:hypothetical protein